MWRDGLGKVFEAFRAGGHGCGRGDRYESSSAVRVADSAIEINAAVPSDPFFDVLRSLPMARLLVRRLRGLNVATARQDRSSSSKLQRQEREH